MLLSELLKSAEIEYNGNDCEIDDVVCDSREAREGTVFVCIAGFVSDGHAYAVRAYDMGCRVFVAERELDLPSDAIVIMQENTRIALAGLCAAIHDFPARKLKVIGITGTKGKTTTSLMIASVLNKNGIPTGYIGSNGVDFGGNHFETANTTPDSLTLHRYFADMLEAGMEAVVLEVSSQAIYLDRVHGISFYATAFTNLAPDHIGGNEHPTFEHYRDTKKRLFDEYFSANVFYNADEADSGYMMSGLKTVPHSFGVDKGELRACGIAPFMQDGELGISFTAYDANEKCSVKLPMPGAFNVSNALCAISIAESLGVSLENIAAALGDAYASGRFEIVKTNLPAVFVIDYAHNGYSLTSALTTLRKYSPNRLFCVVGSVGGRTKGRRAELGEAASRLADVVVLTSDNPDFEDPIDICNEMKAAFVKDVQHEIFADRADAVKYVIDNVQKDDIVLFAGKGHEQYQFVRGGKIPFSERKLIETYAAEMSAELV